MRLSLAAALGAALVFSSGCSLMIDPESIPPPEEQQPPPPPPSRGACVDASGGHRLCGGLISGGGRSALSANGGHAVNRASVAAASQTDLSNSQHRISRGAVTP